MAECFTQSQLEAIANALGDTAAGLTGPEIGFLLASSKIDDETPTITKRRRLYNAFAQSQNSRQDRGAVLAFIRKTMKPERFVREPHRFEPMRANLNRALSFAGLMLDETGMLGVATASKTLPKSARRAQELRADLMTRGVHPDILTFCRAELLENNYFHAVLEATKSIANKLRVRAGVREDGAALVDRTLAGDVPILAINSLSTDSEKSEQRGFANLVKGTFGMFRNTTAHEARILWAMSKDDAEDLLSLASLIHRRLDSATIRMPLGDAIGGSR